MTNPRRAQRLAKGPTVTSHQYTCVAPMALAAVINSVLLKQGHGSNNLSVPLTDANGNITHYGCSVRLTTAGYNMLRAMFPPEAEASAETFDEMLLRKGLHKIDPEE